MAYINDLDPKVLYRILYLASGELAKDIDKWKHKLTLLQVCTKWYHLFKSYVFSQGFVGVYLPSHNRHPKVNLKSCVYYADNKIVCRSNLGIITGRDRYNCDCVSDLNFIAGIGLHINQYSHVLQELLTLGVGYWLNLSSISFNILLLNLKYSLRSKDMTLDEISATASNYIHDFQNRIPNITQLVVNPCEDVLLRTALCIIVNHYASRLQRLHLYCSFKPPLPLFSPELTSLSLDLHNYTHHNPSFYAKSLQYLRLYNISSSDFSWWMFHDFTTPGRIEFTYLKTLNLWYEKQTDEERELSEKYSKQTRPYGSHMLRFPKLENLTLWDHPVDCDVLFTDTVPTHLEGLNIHGYSNSIVAASRLRFKSVNKMHICVYGEVALNNDFYIAADRYFGYTKIGSRCSFDKRLSIDIQRTVSWVNVTNLQLDNIHLYELLDLLYNLYKLQKLRVGDISLSDKCLSIIRSGLVEEKQGEFKILDTKLEHLVIHLEEPDKLRHFLALLNHLILRTTALRHVETSGTLYSYVMKSFLPEKFQHINFIKDVDTFSYL